MEIPTDASRALHLACAAVAGRDDVVSIGLGPHTEPGKPAVHVITSPKADRTERAALPAEIGGFAVVASRMPTPQPLLISPDLPGEPWFPKDVDVNRTRHRELIGGIAITSTDNRGAGSLGFFMTSAVTGRAYGISNMHVLAPGNEGQGAEPYRPIEVHHPMTTDRAWYEPQTEIGLLTATADGFGLPAQSQTLARDGTPIVYGQMLDLAVFELRSGVRWLPAVEGLGGITGVATDITFDRICLGPPYPVATKGAIGDTPTGGHIHCMSFWLSHDTGLPLPPTGKPWNEMVKYGGQLVIRSNPQADGSIGVFSQFGDSGGPILNVNHELVGIIRAGIGYAWEYDPARTWDRDGDAPDIPDCFAHPIWDITAALDQIGPTHAMNLEVALAESTEIADITPRVQP